MRDRETGRILYRRTPSFKIINKLKSAIPTEYWYEEASEELQVASPKRNPKAAAPRTPEGVWMLSDNPFCGVVSAYECDPGLPDRSGRFPSPIAKIVLDFSF